MQIKLPPKKIENGQDNDVSLEFNHIVVVGANGAGKTRFGSWIEENTENVHRISAQKSLSMPSSVSTTSIEIAEKDFLVGSHSFENERQKKIYKKSNRWHNDMNTSLLDDYSKLMVLLHTEEYDQCLKYKDGRIEEPFTKLDKIQRMWEELIPNRKLRKGAGIIEVYPNGHENKKYNGSGMSDGERVIFYLIGEALCAPQNSIIIIDEPEIHIHASLIKRLFDLIEDERPDCSFIYLTHSIDFAVSRYNATKIWAKSYEDGIWDYKILEEDTSIPEQLYLELLGNRMPVIFIEGDSSSWDNKIYSQLFKDFTLKPVGSCNKVIQMVRAFNRDSDLHHIKAYGIIDHDRRSQEEINDLVNNNIWVLNVAESENLFLLEDIVKVVAEHMGKDSDNVVSSVKRNLIGFFSQAIEQQTLIHLKSRLYKKYSDLTNFAVSDIGTISNDINHKIRNINIYTIYNDIKSQFQQIINTGDYERVLKVFNMKNALIPNSKVVEEIGVRNQNEYRELIIALLKTDNEQSEKIRNSIIAKITH